MLHAVGQLLLQQLFGNTDLFQKQGQPVAVVIQPRRDLVDLSFLLGDLLALSGQLVPGQADAGVEERRRFLDQFRVIAPDVVGIGWRVGALDLGFEAGDFGPQRRDASVELFDVGAGGQRLQVDQGLALLHGVAFADQDFADDPAFQVLDALDLGRWDDLAQGHRDHVQLAEITPGEESDHEGGAQDLEQVGPAFAVVLGNLRRGREFLLVRIRGHDPDSLAGVGTASSGTGPLSSFLFLTNFGTGFEFRSTY